MRLSMTWVAPLVTLVIVFAVLSWIVRRAEPKLAFFPIRGEDVTPQQFGVAFKALPVATDDGETLRAWHLPRDDARAQVVYFHGNGGNLSMWADILVGLWQQRFDVVAVDYRGYGMSTGSPSEQGLYRDVAATISTVRAQLRRADRPLIYWGRSLGTPMAAYAAAHYPADGVVLEAGFPTMRSVVAINPVLWTLSWFSSYRFPTAEWMAQVQQPVLVIHGDDDSVIPYHLGQRLYEQLREPKTFITIPGGDHNDAVPRVPEIYWQAVEDFIARLTSSSAPR
jgi:fermentation-respiration switch protein FrsA (DUF1100 family)